jgi:serine/threonine protein kinase
MSRYNFIILTFLSVISLVFGSVYLLAFNKYPNKRKKKRKSAVEEDATRDSSSRLPLLVSEAITLIKDNEESVETPIPTLIESSNIRNISISKEMVDSDISTYSSNSAVLATTTPHALQSFVVSEKILGYGSHGTVVFEGLFEGRPVAIKRLLSNFYDVADHEVKLLQESDDHPNICRYFHKEYCEGFMYIALELCTSTLFDFVQRRKYPEMIEISRFLSVKDMLQQVMNGIDHLHSLNIVHRDIKPQNILILLTKSKPRIVISDFGLGKRLPDDQSSFLNTAMSGGGSYGYRAPEILLSVQENLKPKGNWVEVQETPAFSSRITRSIDIFSSGCTFYFTLTGGEHPFGDRMSRELNIIKGNFRFQHLDFLGEPGTLNKDLIKKMIMRNSSKRYFIYANFL